MRVTIVGAGAVGAFVGAKLALAGERVSFIARGANLHALRSSGVQLVTRDAIPVTASNVFATDDYAVPGPQDLVILAVKAHQLEAIAQDVPKLFGPDTTVVPMQNGIPYWYFHKHGGPLSGRRIASVDPAGTIAAHVPSERVVGCVVYPATELIAPGIVKLIEGVRFPIGEPDGSRSARATEVSECFERAGLKAPVLEDSRAEMAEIVGQPDLQPNQRADARHAGGHLRRGGRWRSTCSSAPSSSWRALPTRRSRISMRSTP